MPKAQVAGAYGVAAVAAAAQQVQPGQPDFAAGYINYFVINGAIIAPQFGDAQADEKARALLAAVVSGRDIVQLDIDAIAAGGGGFTA
jgi:agmatine/peptidylarginine deiminase